MKLFAYRGFDQSGSRCRGSIEAADLKDARDKLAKDGIFTEQIQPAAAGLGDRKSFGRPKSALSSRRLRAEFYRALSSLLSAGLPISSALEVLSDEAHPAAEGSEDYRIAAIREGIREGSGFSVALAGVYPGLSGFESAVIESGEKTGRLPEVLKDVSDYLEEMGKVQELLKTASIYPAIVIAIALLIATGVLGFMVPHFASMMGEMGSELPMLTRMVVAAGSWFLPVILPVTLLLMAAGYFYVSAMFRNQEKRAMLEQRLARLPFFSRGFTLLVTVRFARTCNLLLSGGLSMVETLSLAGKATGSIWISRSADQQADLIRHGRSLGQAIAELPILNQTVGMWIKAGEAAGDVPGLMHHASVRYRQLWVQYVQRSSTFIEPILILLVALFVLVIALAIILPVLSFNPELA